MLRRAALVVLLLAVENAVLFYAHYRGTAVFTFDFQQTYHAVPFYWQVAAHGGHLPQWMPYQAFGFPLALDLQSGMFYPPLWLFPIAGATYSFRAASILQCLHVFAGSLGAYQFARARELSFGAALLAALAYGAFGGFFCNAQHVDIVRGYALMPFLFTALTLGGRWRAVAVAPVVFLLATGSYPGQWIATLVFGAGYLALQLRRDTFAPIMRRAAAMALGVGLAAISVVPGFALRGEISRVDEVGKLTVTGFGFDHLFTTALPYDSERLGGDISMRSLYIALPIVVGLFLLRRPDLRKQAALAVIAVAAFAMGMGGTVFAIVARLAPPLGYSRFPAADYRALVALPLIVLGAHGLASVIELRERRRRHLAVAMVIGVGFLALAIHRLQPEHWLGLACATGAIAAVLVLTWTRVPTAALFAVVALVTVVEARRIHHTVEMTWTTAMPKVGFKRYAHELQTELARDRASRPERAPARYEVHSGTPDLDGYLRGKFTSDDYAATEHFQVVQRIRASPELSAFLTAASAPRLVSPSSELTGPTLATTTAQTGHAESTSFAAERLSYRITAPSDAILVENEPLFAGWTAELDCEAARPIQPVRALWPLRAWRVPAGTHELCVRYATPTLGLAAAISLASLLLWLATIAWTIRYSKTPISATRNT